MPSPHLHHLLSLLTTTPLLTLAAMGPSFSLGPVTQNAWIRSAESTLLVPSIPTENAGDLSLWVGMGTSNGDLVQAITDQSGGQEAGWSAFTYTLLKGGPPVQDEPKKIQPGDWVTSRYTFENGNYTQTVLVNGDVFSTLSTSSGHALGFGSAVECAATDCGSVGAHKWVNTTIVLDAANPDFKDTFGTGEGVNAELVTSDGGKTWTIKEASIPAFTFY